MTKSVLLNELVKKLNKNKAFPVYKKKITNDDLKLVFSDKELKKKSSIKSYTLIFGCFVAITGLFSLDIVKIIVGSTFVLGSLFMENTNKKFLKSKIKKDSEILMNAYENGLVDFHLMGGIGKISHEDTKIIFEDEEE